MSSQKRACILHLTTADLSEDVKPFDKEVWEKVQNSNRKRQSKPMWLTSKYSEVCLNLPDTYSKHHGYHTQCYKNFTAVPQENEQDSKAQTEAVNNNLFLRSDSNTSFNNMQFPDLCLFCSQKKRRSGQGRESIGACENKDAETKIKDAAKILNDSELLAKISTVDFIARGIKYHHSCRRTYLHQARITETNDARRANSELTDKRLHHEKYFSQIKDYVRQHIVKERNAELLTSLYERYKGIRNENNCYDTNDNAYNFGQKLLKCFDGEIEVTKLSNKQGNIVYPVGMDITTAMEQAYGVESRINEAALHLRSLILKLKEECEDFQYPLTADNLVQGQTEAPEQLLRFFRILISGSPDKPTERVQRYTESMAEDCLFTCTKGVLKPSKHVYLGLGLKSLTGSRKVIDILNHFGHCLNYHKLEELETDLAMSVSDKQSHIPSELSPKPGLATGIAWDNYDHNAETMSGSGTLHDTFGICYQNVQEKEEDTCGPDNDVNSLQIQGRRTRKRKFETQNSNSIEPYRKRPKMTKFEYRQKNGQTPDNLLNMKRRDQAWTISSMFCPSIPMWVGWNACITLDKLPQQNIGYMENISLPPTRLDVVAETLKISQKIADECHEEYAIVHYDLAIAKPAKQIQVEESPKYDNIFICFGPFHIQLAYFGSLGYILEESGGPHILTDCEVLGSGSLNGVLRGKHYNRCKRLHSLLFQAFRVLHLKQFLDNYHIPEIVTDALKRLNTTPSPEIMEEIEHMPEYDHMMTRYEEYLEKTRLGEQGKTAQFWIHYTDLVQLYLLFSRACHTNDLELFTYCIGKMATVFFATSRQNYARWMVKYHLDLLNMDESHPGLRETFQQGALTIRRTKKSFSRTPVDLTLEQTVNADAASRQGGITQFSTSLSARRRWMATHSVRSRIVSFMLNKAGMNRCEDIVQETRPSRTRRDQKDLNSIVQGITNTMNPFSSDANTDELYCLSTGKTMPKDISDDMTTIQQKGQQWMEEFKEGCFTDASRFEKPIKRRKVKNFAQVAVSSTITSKGKQVRELKCSRDLFGRLLYLATTIDIDLRKVFSYPLTPVPLALSHIDGNMMKTDKSKLMKKLESMIESVPPPTTDVTIVDGMFFIQTLTNLPTTFGGIAKVMLSILARLSNRVDFVADTYKTPSIKDSMRTSRGCGHDTKITGPEQRRPNDFQKALKSSSFKESLLRFLSEEWKKDSYATVLQTSKLYFGFADCCNLFEVSSGKMKTTEVVTMACVHEEADTRIVWHLKHCTEQEGHQTVVVRSSDTDVFVILLFHAENHNVSVWMDVGCDGNNNRRYISITQLSTHLGSTVCKALPSLHAYTGCDYTAAFSRKGKVRPSEIALKSDTYLDAFGKLGISQEVEDKTAASLESFVCTLYGKPNLTSVDDARYSIFRAKYAPSSTEQPLAKLKGADPSLLPPSKKVLKQKLLRSNYVAYIWKHADKSVPCELLPTECGWKIENGNYQPIWYDGKHIPNDICQDISKLDIDGDGHDNGSDDEDGTSSDGSDDSDSLGEE